MRDLLEAGVHFGHQTGRWNPKMAPYIYGARNGVHILDLAQTVTRLEEATEFVRELSASGQQVLFVGTKRQAQDVIRNEADRANMPYVVTRWLGGTLTNFPTIRKRVDYMIELERREEAGQLDLLPKKEALKLRDKLTRLHRYLRGLRDMNQTPGALFVVDVPREHIAVAEARRLKIPIIAVCDTNSDPNLIDYPIPSNDDAIRAVRLLTAQIADAAQSGGMMRQSAVEGDDGFEETEPAQAVAVD
ncbi:MAG: 30S ribosomal protein S2 [Chloroflexi bacterium]|nr:30S ribosomal protein S2 [Chloroflexota bacterium]MYF80958.1 30S ribosomal protein S2 [Chloroflexota bacterium]MYI05694.1 30S ribosomal protein S2 [Chloroflexota bacterium]